MQNNASNPAVRASGMGGSDIATILGLNPHQTLYQLYLEKTGEIEPRNLDDNNAVQFGKIIENTIADFYTHRTGLKLRNNNQTIRHPKYDWLFAHIDKKIEGIKKGVEIKNVGVHAASAWGKDGTDEVAEYYVPQVMHYMMIMDYQEWDVAAYFGGADLRVYTLERDKEFDELIIDATHDFWHNNVLARIPPEIDYEHKSTSDVLKRLYPGSDGTETDLTELYHWHLVKTEADKKAKEYELIADGAKNHLIAAMGNSAIGRIDGTGCYQRSFVKRKGFTVEPTEYMKLTFKKNG